MGGRGAGKEGLAKLFRLCELLNPNKVPRESVDAPPKNGAKVPELGGFCPGVGTWRYRDRTMVPC